MPSTESIYGTVPNKAHSSLSVAVPVAPHSTPTSLSTLPIFVLRDARLTDGPKREIRGGTYEWLPKSLAEMVEKRGEALILTACSVMQQAVKPSGGAVHPRSELAVLPFSDSGPLEQAGALKIMRTDEDVALHREIWTKHGAEGLEMVRRAKEMHREADDLARRAQSPSRLPVFDWDGARARLKSRTAEPPRDGVHPRRVPRLPGSPDVRPRQEPYRAAMRAQAFCDDARFFDATFSTTFFSNRRT